MKWIMKCMFSSIGSKQLVAKSGLFLLLFLIIHFLGNSLLLKSSNAINNYAHTLHSLGLILWIVRLGLFLFFILHVFFALKLTWENMRARPIRYAKRVYVEASLASRTMWITGILILIFLSYHLAHFTLTIINPNIIQFYNEDGSKDVFKMVISGFSNPLSVIAYISAMLCLGFHLSHGIASIFQTFGISHPKYDLMLKVLSYIIAWGLAIGNSIYPLSVILKIIT